MKKLTPEDWEDRLTISENVLNSLSGFYGISVEEHIEEVKRNRIHTIYRESFAEKKEHPGYEWCDLTFKTTPKCEFQVCGGNYNRGKCNKCDEEFFRENKDTKWKMVNRDMSKLIKYYCKTQEDCDKLDWAIAVLSESTLWEDSIVKNALLFVDGKVRLKKWMNELTNQSVYNFVEVNK